MDRALATGALMAFLACTSRLPCRDCDVILITVDTLRRDHVSAYVPERRTTPVIDAFFADATRFTRATSPSPCTVPAVQQILTGRLNVGVEAPRLAERLRAQGYRTGAFVSQHFFRDPHGPRPEYARGFDHFDVQPASAVDHHGMTTRTAAQVTDSAVTWIAKAGNAKLHIWLHYFDPHDPYAPPTVPAPNGHHPGDRRARQCAGDRRRAACERHGGRESLFSPAETRQLVDLYDQEIRYLDREVGRVLAALGPRLHRAVVIFTSDHGEHLGEGGQWDHCQSLHSREIDVPLLVSVRQRPIPRLGDPHVLVSTLDLAPTILGLIGLDKGDSRLDGWDLRRMPTGRKVIAVWQKQQVIMNGPYKLYAHPNRVQLFRVDRDPAEENDLAATEPGVRDALATALASVSEQYREAQDASHQIAEQLRAIGYVQ